MTTKAQKPKKTRALKNEKKGPSTKREDPLHSALLRNNGMIEEITAKGYDVSWGLSYKTRLPRKEDPQYTRTFVVVQDAERLTGLEKYAILEALKFEGNSDVIWVNNSHRIVNKITSGWFGFLYTNSSSTYFMYAANGNTTVDHRRLQLENDKPKLTIYKSMSYKSDNSISKQDLLDLHDDEKRANDTDTLITIVGGIIGLLILGFIWLINQ